MFPDARTILPAALLLLASLLAPSPANAQKGQDRVISVGAGDAQVVYFRSAVEKISIADPRIADVKSMGSYGIQVIGKGIGETSIVVVDKSENASKLVVNVGVPVGGLLGSLRTIFPKEDISARSLGNTVILTGTVKDPLVADRAVRLAEATVRRQSSGTTVLNFLNVRSRQQVQVRVRIAEVSRSALRQLGANAWLRYGGISGGMLGPGTSLGGVAPDLGTAGTNLQPGPVTPPAGATTTMLPQIVGPISPSAFGFHVATDSATLPIAIALNILQGRGLAKVLSEPTLVAYSGQSASFLAGGEFPVPIPQALGQNTIQFKKYGVSLTFTPTVLNQQHIHLKVSVSVSERDQSGAVTIQGTQVPGLTTRESDTTVRLRDGHSVAIAGLLHDRIVSTSRKVPLLGDIPLLGMLFRQTHFEREERELVILATANLVRPLRPGEVPPLPGEEEGADPGALAFFLLGTTDPELKTEPRSKPAGPVGYSE